jgi:eukaryotic-like serine/threonine-protein kinase
MSVSTTDDAQAVENVREPDSTMDVDLAGLRAVMATASSQAVTAGPPPDATITGSVAESHILRRHRLAAAALLLAFAYTVLLAWHLVTRRPHPLLVWVIICSRFVLTAGIAGLLLSTIRLSAFRVRLLEFALFGGVTLIVTISQYVVNLSIVNGLVNNNDAIEMVNRSTVNGLMGDAHAIEMVAFMKNGIIQMVVLMLLYGTFIPNRPKTVAWVVLVMALAPLLSIAMLTGHPNFAGFAELLRTAEYAGSNAMFLVIAAAMAVSGSALLNGLRTELRQARKYGQYRLMRKLGEGGMGEVYLAEHLLLKRPCALKLIKPEAGSDPIALARFEREVQSAARLSHPNTIEIFDYGHTDDGTFYYVMEYLRGMSLSELVRRDGPVPPGRVIYIFRQVCAGLAEAHGLGLVHRDLKPGNLFLAVRGGEADVAKVLDFGLVKLTRDPDAAELSREMTVSGTPMYMAPEQAIGDRSLDTRADIYALGAMIYYALTARPPFTGETPFIIMMAQARDPVVPPAQVNPGVPADLEQVVLRCLAKKPSDRFPSVKALGDALAACASAPEWGPNRAEAWWISEGIAVS